MPGFLAFLTSLVAAIIGFMDRKAIKMDRITAKETAVNLATKTDQVAETLSIKTEQAANLLAAKVDDTARAAKEDSLANREATKEVHVLFNSRLDQWKAEQAKVMEEWKVQQAKIMEMAIESAHQRGYEQRRTDEKSEKP